MQNEKFIISVYPDKKSLNKMSEVPLEWFIRTDYFKDIVGVTRFNGEGMEQITIRTVDFKVHHLLRTKPIHSSQMETMSFDQEKGFGEFSICVIPNLELQARLLGYGKGLYVLGDTPFRQRMQDVISQLSELYK